MRAERKTSDQAITRKQAIKVAHAVVRYFHPVEVAESPKVSFRGDKVYVQAWIKMSRTENPEDWTLDEG